MSNLRPATIEEVQAAVQAQPRLLPRGSGSKPSLSTPPLDTSRLELAGLSQVLEYEPEEYTFTALAGTPVAEVETLLAQHGQYLPFDPLLAERGATLGGTVAANASGPGRYRYGGVRDFLLGVRFVDGEGRLVRGGSKVVKNSAGFDIAKLMVGSLGRLGVLVELTFKVFPRPEAYATLKVEYPSLTAALAAIYRLNTSPLELNALDLEPISPSLKHQNCTLWLRLGGLADALPGRLERLRNFLMSSTDGAGQVQAFGGAEDEMYWKKMRELARAPAGWALVKVPLTPGQIPALEAQLKGKGGHQRYSVGGNLAWLTWPADLGTLDAILKSLNLMGLVLFGASGRLRLGAYAGEALLRRVKQALDPAGRFLEV